MQHFATDRTPKNKKAILSRYDSEVQSSKNKVITLQNLNLAQYSTSKQAFQYYYRGICLVVIGLVTSALTYPISVKIAKRVFKLRDFINIHMAVLPIMMNANAFVLGIAQGHFNHFLLTKQYQSQAGSLEEMLL